MCPTAQQQGYSNDHQNSWCSSRLAAVYLPSERNQVPVLASEHPRGDPGLAVLSSGVLLPRRDVGRPEG